MKPTGNVKNPSMEGSVFVVGMFPMAKDNWMPLVLDRFGKWFYRVKDLGFQKDKEKEVD